MESSVEMEENPCSRLDRCQEPLLASFKRGSSLVFPSIEHDELHQVCRSIDNISTCVQEIQPTCLDLKRNLYYEQNRGVLNFLCGPGFHNYTIHKDCLDSTAVEEVGADCYDSYRWRLNELIQNRTDSTWMGTNEAMCSAVDDLIECVSDGVKRNCTHPAGEFSRQLKEAIWDPAKKIMFKCHLIQQGPVYTSSLPDISESPLQWRRQTVNDSMSSDLLPTTMEAYRKQTETPPIQPPIIFIIVFTAVMIAAVVLLVCFVYRRGRKSQGIAYSSSFGVRFRFLNSLGHKLSLTGRTTDRSGSMASLVHNIEFTECPQANDKEMESESLKNNQPTSETKLEMSPTGHKTNQQSASPQIYTWILESSGE